MIEEIVRGVFTIEHRVAEGKNAVIFGDRDAWAVDTGSDASEGVRTVDLIRAHGYLPNRLIYTHGHGDHILGSAPFAGADIFAHRLTPVEMRRLLPTLAACAGCTANELGAQLAWPTVTFRNELFLDLGNRRLQLFPTPGHSQDGISIYLEEERLLIAGDAVVTGIVPAIGDGDSTTLEATLRRLATLDIEILIPGHGPVICGRAEVQDWLTWLPNYLRNVRHCVQTALATDIPVQAIVERCEFDDFVGARLPREKHNMVKRHQATVTKIVQESIGQP